MNRFISIIFVVAALFSVNNLLVGFWEPDMIIYINQKCTAIEEEGWADGNVDV